MTETTSKRFVAATVLGKYCVVDTQVAPGKPYHTVCTCAGEEYQKAIEACLNFREEVRVATKH